jgi:V8-like Glu-specific endopeptidase
MALIRANRESIDDRFSVLGFTVRSENPLFEIGLATDPELLKAENRQRRTASNFFSTRLLGAARARASSSTASNETVYLVPPNVVARFVGQPRLYFGLATYQENDRSHPATIRIPDRGNMYVNLSGLTERGLRRTARSEQASGYGNGAAGKANGDALGWGGDLSAAPGSTTAGSPGAAPVSKGGAAGANAGPAPYSDGYSDDLWQRQHAAPEASAATPAAPAPASTPASPPVTEPANAPATAPVSAQAYPDSRAVTRKPNGAAPLRAPASSQRPLAQPLLVSPYYQPTGWFDALRTQIGFFASSAMWFLGVTDTTVPPHSAICQVRRPDGSPEGALHGSAFFIAPRLLLTAAHVVDGQDELIIVPGKNGGSISGATEPFGRFRVSAAAMRKHPSYAAGNEDFDMAVICVPAANAASGDNYFNLVEELTQSRPEGVVVCGYAANWYANDLIEHFVNDNIDPNKQHLHGGYIRSLPTEETFDYDLQTLGGTSGAPVYWIEDAAQPRAHLVGVHVAAHSETTNLGCRITAGKRQWIAQQAGSLGVAFSLARSLENTELGAGGEEDPDAFGISEAIPEPAEGAAPAQALRVRALEAPLPDYPGASRFAPAHPRNFTVARGERTIDRVVIHITAGGSRIAGTIGWFQNPDQRNSRDQAIRVSAHYIVGREGEVVQMVRNRDYAHHASSANRRSIGIEHNANKQTGLNPTEPQYEASARLTAWLCGQYGLPIDREHIVGHQEISPRDNHDCPSSIWDWEHYIDCVRVAASALAGTAAPAAQSLGVPAYAKAQEIITPFYDPADPASALRCQADAFSQAREEWFAGVPNTTIFPHSAICLLEMRDGSGGLARGTGFYIGANRILTCGHNLHNQASVDIIPGKNGQGGGSEPFGRCTVDAASWRIPASYGGSNPAYDLAVIDNVPIAAPVNRWFDVLEELNQSRPEGVVVCGYSSRSERVPELTAAIDGFKQHLHAGYIAALGPGDSTFDYPILSLKRASGSPVYYLSDKDGALKAYIVGVHTGSASDDLNRGCRLTTAKIDWIEGRTSALTLGAQALAGGGADYPVALIPQPNKDACWAAAMTMLLSWRRQTSYAPETLANEVGGSLASSYSWELLDAVRARYGFEMIAQPSNASLYQSPQQWSDWLDRFGPLWVVIVGAPHAVVLAGIRGNLADPASVQVKVLNPWDTRVAFDSDPITFNPANKGYQDWLSFSQFAADFGNMAEPDYGNWRVLYLPPTAAAAQSLGSAAAQPVRKRGYSSAQDAAADDPDAFQLAPPPAPVVRALEAARALDGGATVAIASVVAGAVMERLANNDGDIRWELEQLRGFKHPNDIAPNPLPPAQDGRVLRLDDWPKINVGFLVTDEISAGFEINWQYNGKSVGNVMISNIATNDAVGWGLKVTAKIMDDNIVYPRGNPSFAALRIRFEYRFDHFVKGDKIAIRDIHLFGDGGYTDDGRWEQT